MRDVNERRQRSDIIGEFLAPIAEGLDFGLGGWGGDGEAGDLAVLVAERHGDLVGPGRLGNRRRTVETHLLTRGLRSMTMRWRVAGWPVCLRH